MKKFFLFAAIAFGTNVWADGAPAKDQSGMSTLIMIGAALVFFYFILWRPEQKRKKQVEMQRKSMKVGDRVTAMGIIGTVSKIGETTVVLKMCDGAKIEVLKAVITDVQPSSDEVKTEVIDSK